MSKYTAEQVTKYHKYLVSINAASELIDYIGDYAAHLREREASKGVPHPDDVAIDLFAFAMKEKLAEARAKGRSGWQDKTDCPQSRLSNMLRAHVEKGDPRDVANFCMFLHQRGESILPRSKTVTELLIESQSERESAKAGVTDETTQIALNAYNKSLFAGSYGPDDGQPICHDYTLAMRAALEAVAPMLASVRVPDAWNPTDAEVMTWMERNDIDDRSVSDMRTAIDDARSMHMLAAAPKRVEG